LSEFAGVACPPATKPPSYLAAGKTADRGKLFALPGDWKSENKVKIPAEILGHCFAANASTLGYWLFDEVRRSAITAEPEFTACGTRLTGCELESLPIFFLGRRHGELVFPLEPGGLFARSEVSGGGNPMGLDVYGPSDIHSRATFLNNRLAAYAMRTTADFHLCLEDVASWR
jgi:hypothetical protein